MVDPQSRITQLRILDHHLERNTLGMLNIMCSTCAFISNHCRLICCRLSRIHNDFMKIRIGTDDRDEVF